MGSIGNCFDNSVIESFFGTLQNELLDEHDWRDSDTLARAIFEWIETWYNPRRRHSYCGYLGPIGGPSILLVLAGALDRRCVERGGEGRAERVDDLIDDSGYGGG
jgi:transposase InsO family protein